MALRLGAPKLCLEAPSKAAFFIDRTVTILPGRNFELKDSPKRSAAGR
jgi:hypothetical protein